MKRLSLESEVYWGTSDSWGFEIIYSPYDNSLTIMLIHWYFGISIWKKKS